MKSNLSCYFFSLWLSLPVSCFKTFAYSQIQDFIFTPFTFCLVAFCPVFQPVKIILNLTAVLFSIRYCFQLCVICKFDKLLNAEWKKFFSSVIRSKGNISPSYFQDIIGDKGKLPAQISNIENLCNSDLFYYLRALFLRFDIILLTYLLTSGVYCLFF